MYISTSTLVELAQRASEESPQRPAVGRSTSAQKVQQSRDKEAWYLLLLRQTLEMAQEHVPFYRKREEEGRAPEARAFTKLSDLKNFPILGKGDFAVETSFFLNREAAAQSLHCTSGTTSRRLIVYGNEDEARARASLLHLRQASAPQPQEAVHLRVMPGPRRFYSGGYGLTGANSLVISFSTTHFLGKWFDGIDFFAQVLNETYYLGNKPSRISSMHLTPPWMINYITERLKDSGFDPMDFGLKHIALTGGFATRQMRQMVVDQWGAMPVSSYSCTEAGCEALESEETPGLYYPSPGVYCEIVDTESFEPVSPGEVGLVLLTPLYPFQQVMPFIRYSTGDLARRVAVSGRETPLVEGLELVGRVPHCHSLGKRRFLGTRHVLEAVSHFSKLPQVPYPRYELSVKQEDQRPVSVHLKVESAEMPDAKRLRLARELAGKLKKECLDFYSDADLCKLGFSCELLPKGSLTHFNRLYPDR